MVLNEERGGWEMPGGRIEPAESPEQAATREVREECGCSFLPLARLERRDGVVFCGELTCLANAGDEAEMRWELFSDLPSPLAFGMDEYLEVLTWARRALSEHRNKTKGFRSDL